MSDPKHLAHQHAAEFLDETANVSGSTLLTTEMLTVIRQARGIIMECMTALAPAASRTLAVEHQPITYDDSLQTRRSVIFEARSNEAGWYNGMLAAIRTAQKLGAMHFEVSVRDEQGRIRPSPISPFQNWLTQEMFEDNVYGGRETTLAHITIYAVQVA